MKTGTSKLMDSHLVDFSNTNANTIKSGSTTSSNFQQDNTIEKLSYALGEAVGLLKGIEKTCHDKMLKYEIQQAIEKLEKINGSNTKI